MVETNKEFLHERYKPSMIVDFNYIEDLHKRATNDADFDILKQVFESFLQKNAITIERVMRLMEQIDNLTKHLEKQVSVTDEGTGFFYGTPFGSQVHQLIDLDKEYQRTSRIEVSNLLNLFISFLDAKKTSRRPMIKKEEKATKMIDVLSQKFQEGEL